MNNGGKAMKESMKPVRQLIDSVTQTNKFNPVEDNVSTGLSPDLTDEEIKEMIDKNCEKED